MSDEVKSPKHVGESLTRRAESRTKKTGPGRRAGDKRSARDRTGVDPQEPIDPRMPHL